MANTSPQESRVSGQKLNVRVSEAVPEDSTALATIFLEAFSFPQIFPFDKTEPVSLRPSPSVRIRRTAHRLVRVINDPDYLLLKATDENTGEIVGWMGTVVPARSWGDHPLVSEESERDSEQDRESWKGVDRKIHNDSWKAWDAYRQSILPPGLSHYCIAPLCVSPSHQNRSIGSALLSHLTQIADEKSLPIYLDASKAGEGLYRKKGWICWGDAGREFAPMVRWGKAEVPKGEWDKAYERNTLNFVEH